jgi:diacylglycerol kinase (ATP)
MQERIALFVNTASRQGERAFEEARALLEEAGAAVAEAVAFDDAAKLTRWARDAVQAGIERVVVGAGDGTLSAVARELAGTGSALGVLPLGTGNDFARSMRIPLDLDAACAVVVAGRTREVDVALAGDRLFLNAASVGLSTAITRRLTDELKRRLGRAAFAVAAAGEAPRHHAFQVRLEWDAGNESLEAHQVVVGNGRFHGGGRLVAPEATHQDHRLDVYVIRSARNLADPAGSASDRRLRDLWNLFRVGTLLRRGRHLAHPTVTHLRATRVRLTAEPVQEIDVDGELSGQTPMEFVVHPKALRVLVPG